MTKMISEPSPETADTVPPATSASGASVLRDLLRTLPNSPGVYRMMDRQGGVLYVGKARNLKRRVANYTKPDGLDHRIQRMVAATQSLEIITTHTEAEALLLEANLIKRLKPRYNVLLRDDKSFPYILLTHQQDWPQILKHRGPRQEAGEYFGPFASAGAVNRTLATLQRAFPLRSCSDAEFASRTRPCLQYQIKRCFAPCVGRISSGAYGEVVNQARAFLTGRSHAVQDALSAKMQAAANDRQYEVAATYRDRLRALAQIQAHQDINVFDLDEADIFAAAEEAGQVCIQVFFFRSGQNLGNRAYYPAHTAETPMPEILSSFIGQFYDARPAPHLILVSEEIEDPDLLATALGVGAGYKVEIHNPQRGAKRKVVEHALANAQNALARRLAETASHQKLLEAVGQLFDLPNIPRRIEVYDNSHIGGQHALGAMIVAGPDGFEKAAYRKFNIRGGDITPGDDYGMMREVLGRRFRRLIGEEANGNADAESPKGSWPDLILIDGGPGQLAIACQVLAELNIPQQPVAAIAKGLERDAGREHIYLPDRPPFMLEPRDPVLYFLQRLRDEAHRFAISSHRDRRSRALGQSPLDEIPGIGPRRKKALLMRFGSARAVAQAGLADLEMVEGVSHALATAIYKHFHDR